MFDLSEDWANLVYSVANVLVVVAAVIGLISAVGLFWAGGIQSKFAALREADNAAKIAAANEGAAKANEGLAKTSLEIEDRKKENLELETRLAELANATGPRKIEQEQTRMVMKRLPPVDVIFECPRDDECEALAEQIAAIVIPARWNVTALRDHEVRGATVARDNVDNDIIIDGPEPHAVQLMRQLNGRNAIQVHRFDAGDLPPNTVRIRIYADPQRYFHHLIARAALPRDKQAWADEIDRKGAEEWAALTKLTPDEELTTAEEEELKESRGGFLPGRGSERYILRREGSPEEKQFLESVERARQHKASKQAAENPKIGPVPAAE